MKKTKRMAAFMLTAAMAMTFMLAGCGSKEAAESSASSAAGTASTASTGTAAESSTGTETGALYDGQTVISCSTWIGYAPLHVALEKGFFKDEGIDVDVKVIESAGDRKTALAANKIQGIASTIDTLVMTNGAGIPVTQVLALDTSYGGDGVISKKEFNSLADLKGKKVALDSTGGASLFWFNYILDEQGLTMKDFDIQSMTAGDAGAAFVSGNVDAAVTWEPWLTNANKTDFGKTLISSKDYPDIIVDTLAFRKDFTEKYPGTIQKIVNAWFKALDYSKSNPDDADAIMAKAMGQSVEEFRATLPTVKFYEKDENAKYFSEGKMETMCKKASDLWVKMGLMEKAVEPKDCYSDAFSKN